MLKGYVVTLVKVPESLEVAMRCIASGEKYGVLVELVPAVDKTKSLKELKREKLIPVDYDKSFSNVGAVFGNFVTQYRIWHRILESDAPGIVLEHDAVFVDTIPDLEGKGDIISLGKPSYGSFKTQSKPGVYPLYSKPGYVPGAHGYYVTPDGAEKLINKAKISGAGPCDLFLGTYISDPPNQPLNVKEIYPWPIEAHDTFSTIQNEKGCQAKHSYRQNKNKFKIL